VKINPKSFANLGRLTPYLEWAEQGLSPSEAKARVIAILQPYLENASVLTSLPIDVLGFEAVFIHHLESDPWAAAAYKGILSEYRLALATHPQKCIEALVAWQEKLARAQSEFHSHYLIEIDKSGLELDEFRVEIVRNIGSLLEACVQPNLRALLHQVRVRRSSRTDLALLENLKFGEVVDELGHTLSVPELVAPPPWAVKLHVFRNIAQHHSTFIRNGRIVCAYKTGQQAHEIEFTRSELLALARRLMQILGILRSARTIFYLDNEDRVPALPAGELRPDIAFFLLTVAVATQGFEVVGVDVSETLAHLQVQDVTEGDARDRGIHASQFLLQVWIYSRASSVRVTYIDKSGKIRLVTDAKNSDCEDIADGRTSFEVLASRVAFSVPAPTRPSGS
jgi:hypothetical protein